ncbi:trypsin-like peptidase domain-containing protein [Cyanobacteria bacterium FACHB-502]|nr:HhoA/HhoB/HtrA family serine endopeptidase [Leptolyngbya sp. FACHB-711]MBD1851504.1 trypsin-like peptidase domain-containing protein [Cyanobacteria bacterium FACHB-502]MBD2024059.1 trypsin-like peptidase domain-containing protein [Leptolyngbya sp. FACHB-711]
MIMLLKTSTLFSILFAVASVSGCASLQGNRNTQQPATSAAPTAISPAAPTAALPAASTAASSSPALPADIGAVATVAKQVGPAVVQINTSRTVRESVNDFGLDEFFGRRAPRQGQVQQGTGSGFITTADGQVITNAHVVADADTVTVVLNDGRNYSGRVVGTDPISDLAVIDIDADNLPTVSLGDSDALVPGQIAIAIGNPLGLSNTVTQGIVSATERSVAEIGIADKRINFLQTDAAINPGNSGGPLLNAAGQVIGVNTAIIQGAQGIGFAIPINTVKQVSQQLVTQGRVDYPYIGIQMAELTPELRSRINGSDVGFQVTQDQGIIVLKVLPDSPAARAGLRAGDVIVAVNGNSIENVDQIQQQVDATGINNTMQLTVNRNGNTQQVTVRPEALPAQQPG